MINNKRKKVLFFTPGGGGGSQRMTVTIAKLLPASEFDVTYVVMDKKGSTIEAFIPKGSRVINIPIRSIWDFTSFRMARVMHKEKADIVFCSLRYMAVHMIMGARLLGKHIQCVVRSDNDMKRIKRINYLLMRLTFHSCKWIIAQQDEMKQEIIEALKVDTKKVVSLQNPLDKNAIDGRLKDVCSPFPDNDGINFVWTARFNDTKGQDILVKAFAMVHKKLPNAHLYLVGDYDTNSAFYKSIKAIISDNKLDDYVHMPGFDTNPYRWMKYCNVFVLPSRFEGLPNALIEAMYTGVPAVAAECIPVVSRIVKDGYNGYVVPKEDPIAMADAMLKAINLKEFSFVYKPAEPENFINLFK